MTLGQVLRRLARQRKRGAYRIAQALGVYPTTVYDWWKDRYAPNEGNLQAYAELMEVTVEEILAQAQTDEQNRVVAERVYAILERIAAGESAIAAFVAETNAAHLLTEERRAALSRAAQQFRETLSDLVGQNWDQAPPALQEQVFAELRRELFDR